MPGEHQGGGATQAISNGERSVIELLTSLFDTSSEIATQSYMKLKSYMSEDRETNRLFESAAQGNLDDDFDTIVERTRNRAMGWNIEAILRQVVMPMAGGYLGYALAVAAGVTGGLPVLIGFLVGAAIFLMKSPGTLEMLKREIGTAIDDIFSPF